MEHVPALAASGQLLSRLAPTPSGFLHKGNGFSFVLTWLLMRAGGGKLLLRIDDADAGRTRPEFLDDIFRSLDWLGLDWDLGPQSPDDFLARYSQGLRYSLYHQLLEGLQQQGVLYACRCSRKQIAEQYTDGIYRGSCRQKSISLKAVGVSWRIRVAEKEVCFQEAAMGRRCLDLARQMGDFAVGRKDGLPAYQVASLADDLHWGVNYIVRGEDLLYSTAAQQYLARLLANGAGLSPLGQQAAAFLNIPFLHHPLQLDEQGQKLSKSAGSTALKSLTRSRRVAAARLRPCSRLPAATTGCGCLPA
ncbi:glutamate--tRNA ligase family protein [Cesiribacter andamanensis]|uniref:Glutamate--tRNA ligase n=1 Tax=Cesiribacter andamanensis AMV16 TaxID=1279009 RepID=M7NBI3_9BACT|nr:glutamate--tRNA ligase family protein [Cesiribacter andamanensis]EMR04622.1 Glutamate--tRNA ligase [Cesiribacter andamanensis AMV16]